MNCSTNCVTHVHFTFSAHSQYHPPIAITHFTFRLMQPDRKTYRHYIGKHSSQKMCPQPLTDLHVRVKLATRVALAWELPPWHLSLVGMRCNGREPKQIRTPFGHCLSAFVLLFFSIPSFLKFGFSFGSFFTFTCASSNCVPS